MLLPCVGIGGRLFRCVRGQVSNMSLLVSVSSRVLWYFITVSSLSTTILVGSWKVICHKLHLRGWLLSRGRSHEIIWVCGCAIVMHIPTLIHTFTHHTSMLLTNSTHIRTLTHTYSTRSSTQGLGILSAMSNVYAIPSGQHQYIRLQMQGRLLPRKWSV